MRRVQPVHAITFLVMLAALVVVLLSRAPLVVAAPDPEAIAALRAHALEFTTLSPSEVADLPVKPDAARAIAFVKDNFPVVDPPVEYLGRLTDLEMHDGDDAAPLTIENRLSYAVQLTGLNLGPNGVHGEVPDSMIHHEMWVFVDATSYEFLEGRDFR